MIVKLEGKLERGFAPWKAMVEGASDKLKEHGMTIIFAGTSAADDNSMTVIIDFASSEGFVDPTVNLPKDVEESYLEKNNKRNIKKF